MNVTRIIIEVRGSLIITENDATMILCDSDSGDFLNQEPEHAVVCKLHHLVVIFSNTIKRS